jgi:hypothetical protein
LNETLVIILLIVHVFSAILAFGPTFAFPFIAMAARNEPMHANFAIRTIAKVSHVIVLPVAVSMLVSGLLMVWQLHINLFATPWLLTALAVYLVAMGLATGVMLPTEKKLIAMTDFLRTGQPPEGGPPLAQITAAGKRMQITGMVLSLLILTMVVLMIWKPGDTSFIA